MAKITRQTLKVFGIDAGGSDIGVFGSLAAGAPTYSNVIATIQSLPAWSTGWAAETIATDRPALEDMNAICHVLSYGVCYLHQMGIPEWDAGTTYYADSYCQVAGVVYYSLQNNNLNKDPTSEPTYWAIGFKGMSYMDLSTNQTVATGTKTFTVSPIVPTQPVGDNSTKVASTAFVQANKNTATDSEVNVLASHVADTVYQNTRSKKILVVADSVMGTNGDIYGYIGATNNPTTLKAHQDGSYRHGGSITFVVPPGWYWKVTCPSTGLACCESWEI